MWEKGHGETFDGSECARELGVNIKSDLYISIVRGINTGMFLTKWGLLRKNKF